MGQNHSTLAEIIRAHHFDVLLPLVESNKDADKYTRCAYDRMCAVATTLFDGHAPADTWCIVTSPRNKLSTRSIDVLSMSSVRADVSGWYGTRTIKLRPYRGVDLQQCNDVRFVIMFVSLSWIDQYHTSVVLIDNTKRTVERFDPQGQLGMFFAPTEVDAQMKTMLCTHMPFTCGYAYAGVSQLVGSYGPQTTEGIMGMPVLYNQPGDPSGFCSVWAIVYAFLRVCYPERDPGSVMHFLRSFSSPQKRDFIRRITAYGMRGQHAGRCYKSRDPSTKRKRDDAADTFKQVDDPDGRKVRRRGYSEVHGVRDE